MTTITESSTEQAAAAKVKAPPVSAKPKKQPPFHVILFDDDDHTYEYVIGMLRKLFGHSPESAYKLAAQVDTTGKVVVDTTTMERAELKRDQIAAFGRDWRIDRCAGSMSSIIEPARA